MDLMVVWPDGSTEFEIFEDENDMWCHDLARVEKLRAQIDAMHAQGSKGIFPCVRLPFDPRESSTWPALAVWPKKK